MRELPKSALERELARQEALLSDIQAQQLQVRHRIQELRKQLKARCSTRGTRQQPIPLETATPTNDREKVALFRRLFRGRPDVFSRLWVNQRKGTHGYAPCCANEWVRGVCRKPRTRCTDCQDQAFLPVTDQVVLDHLQGRHVVGVYPLLQDDTCWFLAVDFDKCDWKDDISAFLETCESLGLSAAVERSRSGRGAHVWFFFAGPVAADIARRMGCYLITETMGRRHDLPMSSYDRLFPNQDTLPRGGFGNLIALPLQHDLSKEGNTVFIDERCDPYPDQWAYLASYQCIEPATVKGLAEEAMEQGRIIAARRVDLSDDETARAPRPRVPSRLARESIIQGPLPERVRIVLSQIVYVERTGLPSALLSQIKHLAAFQNPEFYKKQAMRLFTGTTPRVISCAEDLPEHVTLPRGCLADLEELLAGYGVGLELDDKRSEGNGLTVDFGGKLTSMQEKAVEALAGHDTGILVAPPGVGKTVIGIGLIARRARSTLVLVHRTQLLDQWITQLSVFLDRRMSEIGRIGGGKRKPNGDLDVAMIQSLVRCSQVEDSLDGYGHVVVDECHHVPAVSFERVMRAAKARYITGLTATPHRRDGHDPILQMQLGPVRFTLDPRGQAARRPFDHRIIVRETGFHMTANLPEMGIQHIYRELAADVRRNEVILDDVIGALEEGRSPVVLTERRDHLEHLAERLRHFTRNLIILRGGMSSKQRQRSIDQLAAISDSEERLVLATGRFIGEGFDDARLDTLFLTMPVAWRGTLVQYAGRLHRLHHSKTQVQIFDYVDRAVPMLARMFDKRLRGYRSMGYTLGTPSPLLKPEE